MTDDGGGCLIIKLSYEVVVVDDRMRSIRIFQADAPAIEEQPVEFVERKGKGHPDTLIDGICERTSIELCKYYVDNFGTILHHNVDKGLIIGGSSEAAFGRGRITRPIEVIVTGRANSRYKDKAIPVDDIAVGAARAHLEVTTRFLDLDNEVRFVSKVVNGSADLNQIFARSNSVPLANDTSFGVGFAPFTDAEKLALEAEKHLNSREYKERMPAVGEDIKVMSIREDGRISLNIAIAFVAAHVKDIDEYVGYKERAVRDIEKLAKGVTDKEVTVTVNSGDSHEKNEVYITKSGLSCEAGDDGSVGRGNRANGLITPMRYMSLEAPAGKNPVNHTGKIYSVVANKLASDITSQHPEVKECYVAMVSHIGRKIDDPKNLNIKLIMQKGEPLDRVKGKVEQVADGMLERLGDITRDIALGKYGVY